MTRHFVNRITNVSIEGEVISFTLQDQMSGTTKPTQVANVAMRRSDLHIMLETLAESLAEHRDAADDGMDEQSSYADFYKKEIHQDNEWDYISDTPSAAKTRAPFSYGMPKRQSNEVKKAKEAELTKLLLLEQEPKRLVG